MEIFLVRHGETEWNAAGRFQGALDSRLTERGKEQAARCGARLAEVAGHATRFIASPLGRAIETVEIITRHADLPEIEYDPRLVEVSIGLWDGLTSEEIEGEWPGLLDGSTPFEWYFRAPGGETYTAAALRIEAVLRELSGTVVIVSHGLLARIIRGVFAGLPKAEAIALPVPQDAIWHLHDGRIEEICV